jgi:hypothetical protein
MAAANPQRLWQLITGHRLDQRKCPSGIDWAWVRTLLEADLLAAAMVQDYLLLIEVDILWATDHPNLLHRPPTIEELYADGMPELTIGHLIDAPDVPAGIRLAGRPRSILVVGNQGAGKTTAIRRVCMQLAACNAQQAIFDCKHEHFPVALLDPENWSFLSIHSALFRVGLNCPAGVPPQAWINRIATCLSARFGMIAAWGCFANMLRFLLSALNPQPGPLLIWPSLRLLLDVALAAPLTLWAAKPDYEKTLIQVLETVVQSTDVFDCANGIDLERDVFAKGLNLYLDMADMTPAPVRQFMRDILILQVLLSAIHRNAKIDHADKVLVMDEADPDAKAISDKLFPDLMSPLSEALRLGREYGLMFVIGLSKLYGASEYVLGEPVYHLILNQSDALSFQLACRTLGLTVDAQVMFPALRPGEAIFRESQGPWSQPMLVKICYTPPYRGPLPTNFDSHPSTPAKRLSELPHVQEALKQLIAVNQNSSLRQTHAKTPKLSKKAELLMHAIALHAWAPAQTLWKATGEVPSPAVQIKVCKELAEKGIATSEEVRLGSSNILLYELNGTSAGGRGGITHRHIAHWIRMDGEKQGYKAWVEWVVPDSSHPVDAAWEVSKGHFHIFEVSVTATDNIVHHLEILAECSAIEHISIVLTQKRYVEDLKKQLKDEPVVKALGAKLHWTLAEEFMRKVFP